jgi:hypothetical protein
MLTEKRLKVFNLPNCRRTKSLGPHYQTSPTWASFVFNDPSIVVHVQIIQAINNIMYHPIGQTSKQQHYTIQERYTFLQPYTWHH